MLKGIRLLFSVVALLIIIILAAISCLIVFVDLNKLKPVIIEAVEKKTGYHLLIEGKLSWEFYPKLGIHAKHVMLQTPDAPSPFLDLHDVSLVTEWLPLLRHADQFQGNINIEQATAGKLHGDHIAMQLNWKNQILTLQAMTGNLYGGTVQGMVDGHDLSHTSRWNWNIQLDQIQLKPFIQDLSLSQNQLTLSGLAHVNFQAGTQGLNRDERLKNLNGTLSLQVKEGILEGIDINFLIHQVENFIKKPDVTPEETERLIQQTVFQSLTGSAVIQQGVAETNDLLLISPVFTAKATGNIDLLSQTIHYQLAVMPTHKENFSWAIPIQISGNLHHPKVSLDKSMLTILITKDQFDKVKEKVQHEIQKLPAQADQFINKLLGK